MIDDAYFRRLDLVPELDLRRVLGDGVVDVHALRIEAGLLDEDAARLGAVVALAAADGDSLLDRDPHALDRFVVVDGVGVGIKRGETVVIDNLVRHRPTVFTQITSAGRRLVALGRHSARPRPLDPASNDGALIEATRATAIKAS